MPLQSWVARFVVEDGRVSEEGGLLRTFQRRRLDEPDVDLCLLAEPEGGKAEDLGAQALDNIGRLFLDDRLSLTGALLRSLRSTHQTLMDWNRRSVPRDQVTTGLTAALVSGTTVYLCQTGPSLAYRWSSGTLARLTPGPAAREPIGGGNPEPEVRHLDLQTGDMIIGASQALLDIVPEETLAEICARGPEAALPELYLLTRDLKQFQLFAVIGFEPASAEGSAASSSEPGDGDRADVSDEAPADLAGDAEEGRANGFGDEEAGPAGVGAVPRARVARQPMDVSRPVVRLRNDAGMTPARYPRSTGPAPDALFGLIPQRLLVFALVGAAIIAFALLVLPDLVRESRGERVAELLSQAQTQLSAASVEGDGARKRALLEEASSLAAEALRLDPENQVAAGLRADAGAGLDVLNAVTTLGDLTPITSLASQVTGDVAVEQLEIGGGNAFLLDSAGGRVLMVSLDAATELATVFQAGETYAGIPAQVPLQMTWEDAEDGRLLVLDGERKLFAIRPGALPEPLVLRQAGSWSSVGAMDTFDGNLYVLDPTGGQVHRYFPAAGSFDSEPGPALAGAPEITDAIDLRVTGDIFILRRDGRVFRFELGVEVGFDLAGLDRPLQGPSQLLTSPTTNEVYIVDAGNKRIVVAATEGVFLRQFVSNDFTELVTAALDSGATTLYVVSGDALFTAPLPR